MEPGNAAYHALFAEHLESLGKDPGHERETAVLLSPRESQYWIDLGVLAESRSDFSAAERYYLKAASVDRMFAPRWALMNYYFRRNDEAAFRHWAREALLMAYGDVSPVFRLLWQTSEDAESIRRMIPSTGYMRHQYLQFLMSDGHWQAAPAAARDAAVHADKADQADVNFLVDYCDWAIRNNTASAVEVWNTLSLRGLLPFRPLEPAQGALVTNGEFRTVPSERGFDWHLPRTDGVSVTMAAPRAGINVSLNGDQPTSATVLNEWIPVESGRRYRIDFGYSGESADADPLSQASGLFFEITSLAGGAPIARSPEMQGSVANAEGHLDFTLPQATAATLSLRYERSPGTVRHEEKFTIHKISSHLL